MGFKHVVPQLINKLKNSKDNDINSIELIGNGSETRAFCYIDDLIDGLLILMNKGKDKEIYHIGNDHELSIFELAKKMTSLVDKTIQVKKGVQSHFGGTMRRCPDISKMREIGYKPKTSIDIGLEKSVKWYLNYTNTSKNELL